MAYEPLQHFQLVAHLRAAEQRRERSAWVVQYAAQEGNLLLHEQTGERGQLLRDAMRGGVSAMGRAERIVDVAVGKTCERRRECGVVRLLAGPEAYVLDEQHVAGLERRRRCASLLTGRVVDVGHGRSDEFREALGDRLQFEISDALAIRTAKVGAENDGRAVLAQVGDGRQRLTDAHVIGDDRRVALIWNVEIDADEGSLTAPVEISNGLLLHTAPIASAIAAPTLQCVVRHARLRQRFERALPRFCDGLLGLGASAHVFEDATDADEVVRLHHALEIISTQLALLSKGSHLQCSGHRIQFALVQRTPHVRIAAPRSRVPRWLSARQFRGGPLPPAMLRWRCCPLRLRKRPARPLRPSARHACRAPCACTAEG